MRSWRDLPGAPRSCVGTFDQQILDEVEVWQPINGEKPWTYILWLSTAHISGLLCNQRFDHLKELP